MFEISAMEKKQIIRKFGSGEGGCIFKGVRAGNWTNTERRNELGIYLEEDCSTTNPTTKG